MADGQHSKAVDGDSASSVAAATLNADACVVLLCGVQPFTLTAVVPSDGSQGTVPILGSVELLREAATIVAIELGLSDAEPFGALDRAAAGDEPLFLEHFRKALGTSAAGIRLDRQAVETLCRGIDLPGSLVDVSSVNVRVQQARRAVADSFIARLAEILVEGATRLQRTAGARKLVLRGDLFRLPRLNSRLAPLLGGGVIIGPATIHTAAVDRRAFEDHEIKRTLDNCRLDYVFEPHWPRVLARVSRMLSQGKVVAWFHGSQSENPQAPGHRSVLCDPSSRYSRHNINEFYRQVPLEEPIPVVFAPSVERQTVVDEDSRFAAFDATVRPEWREKLVSALDARARVRVMTLEDGDAQELRECLDHYYTKTGVPALMVTELGGNGQAVAQTPREAVRVMYSSAIDALVMGRFVLMKDFWLLRSHAD